MTAVVFPVDRAPDAVLERLYRLGIEQAWDARTLEPDGNEDWWRAPNYTRAPRALCVQWFRFKPFKALTPASQDRLLWQYFEWFMAQVFRGEMIGLMLTGPLISSHPTEWGKLYATQLAMEEARHHEVLAMLCRRIFGDDISDISPAFQEAIETHIARSDNWLLPLLALYIGEVFGDAIFKVLRKLRNPLAARIFRLIDRDEHRHLSYGFTQLRHYFDHGDPLLVEEAKDKAPTIIHHLRESWLTADPAMYEEFGFDPEELLEHWHKGRARHPSTPAVAAALTRLGLPPPSAPV